MKTKTLVFSLTAGAAAVALLAWAFAPRPLPVELAQARVGPFETTIDEDGRTRLVQRYVVQAPLAARLLRPSLREGDVVAAGDVLAVLQPLLPAMPDERLLDEQRARLGAAEAALARARAGVGAARGAAEQAQLALQRSEQLARQGFVADSRLDADRLALQTARAGADAAFEGERVARFELAQARAALGAVRETSTRHFELRSPVAGQVLKVHHSSEAAVATGTPLVEVGDIGRLEVVAELLTGDAMQARPGSPARIERWGGAQALPGRVQRVEPAAFTKVSALGVEEQRVNVIVDLVGAPASWAGLGDGYRVAVRIVTRSEAAVLHVPVSAVFPRPGAAPAAGEAAHAVFRVEGGRARLTPVAVAARNGNQAWVHQGLAAGDTVIVYPPAAVADGVRVRARTP